MALVKDALARQFHGQVEACLASQAGNYGVRPLIADYLCHIFQVQGLHVYLVRHLGIRHDGGGVGVNQHHFIAFFLEGEAGLGACVVEFGGLAYHDRAGADNHYLVYVSSLWHVLFLHHCYEFVKKVALLRARGSFRIELYAVYLVGGALEALYGAV